MDADTLQRAVTTCRPIVASVRSEQLDDPTPCQSWKVRDLINHMVDAPTFAAVVMEKGSWSEQPGGPVDHASGDFLTAYDEATLRAVASFRADGALSKMLSLPFGEMPGGVFVNIATGDAFTHGWDLAKATGSSTDLNPELATEILETIRPMVPDEFRGQEGEKPFGLEIAVSPDATPADQLAGFLGRQP